MAVDIRPGSTTDAPALMHVELACRVARGDSVEWCRAKGIPRPWRAWLGCAPPFDRHPSLRRIFVAYEHNDLLGFIACAHDSVYAGYRADVAGLYVTPRLRRRGIARRLLQAAAEWLMHDGISRMTMIAAADDGARPFGTRLGGFVIDSPQEAAPGKILTLGFANLAELARGKVR